jgi:hypothetical protein
LAARFEMRHMANSRKHMHRDGAGQALRVMRRNDPIIRSEDDFRRTGVFRQRRARI